MVTRFLMLALMASLLLSSTTLPASTDFDKMWKTVNELEQKGLIRSALAEVDKIYDLARAEKDYVHWIKSYVYKNKYQSQLEEEGQAKVLIRFEEDIPDTPEPVNSILHHYAGQYYFNYIQNNQHRFNQRTELLVENETDVRTWSSDKLEKRARYHLLESVKNEELNKLKSKNYRALFLNDMKVDWDVSLYDELIFQSLQFFENNSINHRPTNRFELDSNIVFLPATEYSETSLDVTDKSDYNYIALNLYQQWIAIHLDDNDPMSSLIDARRLSFAHRLTGASEKYLAALQDAKNKAGASACVYDYYIAQYYVSHGARYAAEKNEINRLALRQAHEIASGCQDCTVLKDACKHLVVQLEEESMSITIDRVNQINKDIPVQIHFRNIDRIYYHIYKLNKNSWFSNFHDNQGRFKLPSDASHVRTQSYNLIKEKDFQSHSFNAEIEAIPAGQYIMILSKKEKWSATKNNSALQNVKFQVSDMAVVNRSLPGQQEFYITNRESGKPLSDVTADFYQRAQYPQTGLTEVTRSEKTNKDGRVIDSLPIGQKRRNNRNQQILVLKNGADLLIVDRNYYVNGRNNTARDHSWTQFFTDRAIYRPGQTIHFKGLHLNRNSEQINSILPDASLTVQLRDANNREVAKTDFVTNEFGSLNGSFIIPVGTLNGRFTLRTTGGHHIVQVEEYKRPTFEAVFDTLKGDYVIGEEIKVSGKAKSLAGNVLQNAMGRYRIVRSTYFPYGFDDYYFRLCFPHFKANEEVANGDLKLNEDGTFNIVFNSVNDEQLNNRYRPSHNYQITITVIDETGESHDFMQNVAVGPAAIKVDIVHDQKVDLSDNSIIKLKAFNYNNQPKNIAGELTIKALVAPKRYITKRGWTVPDIVISDTQSDNPEWTYYQDMTDPKNWSVDRHVLHEKVEINKEKEINLSDYKVKSGKYQVIFTGVDRYGNVVKSERYMDVYNSKAKKLPSYQHHYIVKDEKKYQPGDTYTLCMYSAEEMWVLVGVDCKLKSEQAFWVKLDGHTDIELPVRDTDRGNFSVNTMIVHKDQVYQELVTVQVPWSNKDLKIEYLTFRDKLIPGQKEKWVIKLSGDKKDKVAAEMVAALYDASLDAFVDHSWRINLFPMNHNRTHWSSYGFDGSRGYDRYMNYNNYADFIRLPQWNLYGMMNNYGGRRIMMRGQVSGAPESMEMEADGMQMDEVRGQKDAVSNSISNQAESNVELNEDKSSAPLIRTNLQETVFFYPDLKTDKDGNILIEFTMGEALTKWKLLTFAHTKELEYVLDAKELITQKDFMVFPLFPRFFREYDQINIKSKVVNLTDQTQEIDVKLVLHDGITKIDKSELFKIPELNKKVTLGPQESENVTWNVSIPSVTDISAVTAQVIAQSGNKSDGEEHLVPILTNRKLVTEAITMPLKSEESRTWTLTDLRELMKSESADIQNVALEVTSNPAWYAVLALPYLDEQTHESVTSKMYRFYTNQLASFVINKNSKIKDVFNQWRAEDKGDDLSAFMSHLEKNQELKYVVLNQTPWVAAAQNEEEQRRRIALLFDMNKLNNERQSTWSAITQLQNPDGGFSWMPGGRSSWHTTLEILYNIVHLKELNALDVSALPGMDHLIQKAVLFSDAKLTDYLAQLKRSEKNSGLKLSDDHLSYSAIYHVYIRSYFQHVQSRDKMDNQARDYFLGQAEKYWVNKNNYAQGLIALTLSNYNRVTQAPTILQSLKERSLEHEELGRYWNYRNGYNWYQRPIETQALMIEVFDKLSDDQEFVEALKIWLIKHKQTNHWKTSRATAEAVYALLATGPSILESNELVRVKLSGKEFKADQTQAGTGYFKKSWNKGDINNNLTEIQLINPNDQIAFGSAYWQYFEDLDKIKSYEKTPITINKTIAKQIMTDQGLKISPVDRETKLKIGDRVIIRIEIRVDREMEYVHLQDMRSSGLEPTQAISGYKWQDGMGYYQTIKDASADFFIGYLPKGTFVFEYPLKVSHEGDFSNGITTIQSYYAPEFTSHSEGERVVVE